MRTRSKIYFVRTEDIVWIEAAANYVQLHIEGKVHFVRETMNAIEAQLDPDNFVRVHRSIIINVNRIKSIEPHTHDEYIITMQDNAEVSTSRTYSARLRGFM